MDTEFPNHYFLYPISPDAQMEDWGEYVYANPVKTKIRVMNLYVVDCWLVNIRGYKHPQYGQSPIPIRIQHLGDHVLGARPH